MANPTSSSFSSRLFQELEACPKDLAFKNSNLSLEAACRVALTQGIELNGAAIEKRLREMHDKDPSSAERDFEYHLYQVIGEKKITKQVEIFKQQFEKTGIITAEALEQAADSIERVMSGEGQFSHLSNGKHLLLSRTLNELEKIHSSNPEKSLTERLFALTSFKTSATSEMDRNRTKTIELVKNLMQNTLEMTHDDLIEPEELNVNLWSSEEETTSIYPALPKAVETPVKSLYPQLEETWIL